MRVRHILRPQRRECEAPLNQIDSETAFIEQARLHAIDKTTAASGGDLGRFMRHPGPLGSEQQWFDMRLGDRRIFESSQGCHLVRLIEHDIPPLPPLAQVRERIHFLLQRHQEITLLRGLIEQRTQGMIIERRPAVSQ